MPPQPLSRVIPDAVVTFGPIDLSMRPNATPWIAKCIANWSAVELQLGLMMTAILGETSGPTVAIYMGLIGFRARLAALEAAAKSTLAPHLYEIFDVLIIGTKRSAKKRDRLAHHLWTFCEQLNEDLLLIDPRDIMPAFSVKIAQAIAGDGISSLNQQDFYVPHDKIKVYKIKDFQEIYFEFEELKSLLVGFNKMISFTDRDWMRHQLYAELIKQPMIHKSLCRQDLSQNTEAESSR